MKKIRERHGLAWPIIIAGGILIILAALLARRSDGDGEPQIAVDRQKIDLGAVKTGEPRSFDITITNTGDAALQFREKPYIEVLQGC